MNCLERTFSGTNFTETQESYFLRDINSLYYLHPKEKEMFRNKFVNTITKEITRKYLEFCFSHSLEQIITRPTRVTDQTATLIDHILSKLGQSQSVGRYRSCSL